MLRYEIKKLVAGAIQGAYGDEPSFVMPEFSVEVPESPEHGDYATNAALVLAKTLKRKPMEIAATLVAALSEIRPPIYGGSTSIDSIEIAPPGFINFSILSEDLLHALADVLREGDKHGRVDTLAGKKVVIEFTDPNPFKEFHIGHLYSNAVGEVLARLFESGGAEVKRANYQGDVGLHVAKAIWGMTEKMKRENVDLSELAGKGLNERVEFMGQAYAEGARAYDADEEAAKKITELNKKIFALDEEVKEIYEKGREWSLQYFENIYRRLGTKFDFYYFEREVGEAGLKLVQDNLAKGIFEESEGAVVFPGEKYGLHRRVFLNSEGLPTYEAKELGLAPTKYRDFPYDLSIIVTGSEIIEYFKVLIAALKQINPGLGGKTIHIAHGMVRLMDGKMSSRTGEVVRGEDLLDEVKKRVFVAMGSSEARVAPEKKDEVAEKVTVGAVKYSLLKVGVGRDIVFDIEKSLSLEGDSGPYIQYTHARLKSILRKIAGGVEKIPEGASMDSLEHRLAVAVLCFNEVIEDALKNFLPSTLAGYLFNLARLANEFYHSHPVTQEENEAKRKLRIALVSAVALTLSRGLYLLGIEAPEEM
ncbi:arginine--tRNA ligase [Candidatus Giovannonibacteria bacterium]|nr:arginine--tRNA ligase [Candidatus Giovannonibacteria bacterium]